VRFDTWRDVGDPVSSSRIYSSQDADELVFLNIDRERRSVEELIPLIRKVSEACFMPLSIGGGLRTLQDAEKLIKNGADKVVVNSACFDDPDLVARIADKFGTQAVVVSIDARRDSNGAPALYSDCGRKRQDVTLEEHVGRMVARGAGEIFINSIDRDGTMEGYDLDLVKRAAARATVPVIACGGAGHYNDIKDLFLETGVDAAACGSLFNFGDNNPIRAKAFLRNYKVPLRTIEFTVPSTSKVKTGA
jgi:cyclase